jgi:hypothetical protein
MSKVAERADNVVAAIESLRRYHGQVGRAKANIFYEMLIQIEDLATAELNLLLNRSPTPEQQSQR